MDAKFSACCTPVDSCTSPVWSVVKVVNLEFAVDVTDQDLRTLHGNSLESLNLNACQKY